jgi:glutamate:GABA antiporter
MSDVATPKLRFVDTALYTIAMGTGLRWIAVAAAVGPSSLPLWLIALLVFFLPLAVATAELTGRFEGEGGIYAWVRDTLGPLAGFLCGWSYWFGQFPYFAGILYFLGGLVLAAVGGDPKDTLAYTGISLAVLAIVTAVQLMGLSWSKWLPNFGTAGGWVVLGIIVAAAVVLGLRGQSATDFAHADYMPKLSFDTVIFWGTLVFAYAGAEAVGFLRNEVEGGMRTVVRVLIALGVVSLVVYIAGTVAFLVILPHDALTRLSGFPDALKLGLAKAGAGPLAPYVIGLFALAMLGQLAGWFGVAARLPFAAGIDSFLPASFGRRSPRTGAPVNAIWLQTALTFAIVVLSQAGASVAGAYDFLVDMALLTAVIPYLFMFVGYLKIVRLPPAPQQWIAPGGTRVRVIVGALGLASSFVGLICSVVPNAGEPHPMLAFLKIVLSTVAMLVVGLVLYLIASHRRAAALDAP